MLPITLMVLGLSIAPIPVYSLKDGKLVAKGNHEELLGSSEEYRRIFVKRFDLDEEKLIRVEM